MTPKQRKPKSIRLSEWDEKRSEEIAYNLDLRWHGWARKLFKWSNGQPMRVIRQIYEFDDQEHCL